MIFSSPLEFIDLIKVKSPHFKLLGLDAGDRKIGVAITNSMVAVVSPLKVINRSTLAEDIKVLLKLVNDERINGLVIGLPLSMDGQLNDQSKKVMRLAEKFSESSDIPIIMEDERMTTKLANSMLAQGGLKRKQRAALDDQVSAQIILESFMLKI